MPPEDVSICPTPYPAAIVVGKLELSDGGVKREQWQKDEEGDSENV